MSLSEGKIVRSKKVIFNSIDDELLMLDPDSGVYLGTGAVGKRVWEQIETPKSLNEIVDSLLDEFEVDSNTCRSEVAVFLGQLQDKGLIVVS